MLIAALIGSFFAAFFCSNLFGLVLFWSVQFCVLSAVLFCSFHGVFIAVWVGCLDRGAPRGFDGPSRGSIRVVGRLVMFCMVHTYLMFCMVHTYLMPCMVHTYLVG